MVNYNPQDNHWEYFKDKQKRRRDWKYSKKLTKDKKAVLEDLKNNKKTFTIYRKQLNDRSKSFLIST